jgi:hypothetical protein
MVDVKDDKEKTVSAPVHVVNAPSMPSTPSTPVKAAPAPPVVPAKHEPEHHVATLSELEIRVKKIEHHLHEVQKLAAALGGHTAPPPPESW